MHSLPIPELIAGDHLDQRTFHERYLASPTDLHAELIDGIVHLHSCVRANHGSMHATVGGLLSQYTCGTPGLAAFGSTTIILNDSSEPQPDLSLAVLPEFGGQSHINADDFLEGAPELTVEVALSSESYGLHAKLRDYHRAGVKEYLVVVLRQNKVIWHVREPASGHYAPIKPDANGILKSPFFGGLWLNPDALFRGDTRALQETLKLGLASPEHAKFIEALNRRRK